MLLTFHACREETEAIIREGGDFLFLAYVFVLYFKQLILPLQLFNACFFFLLYVCCFRSQSLLREEKKEEEEDACRHKVHPFTLFFFFYDNIGKG